jgi:hypothetical protein
LNNQTAELANMVRTFKLSAGEKFNYASERGKPRVSPPQPHPSETRRSLPALPDRRERNTPVGNRIGGVVNQQIKALRAEDVIPLDGDELDGC